MGRWEEEVAEHDAALRAEIERAHRIISEAVAAILMGAKDGRDFVTRCVAAAVALEAFSKSAYDLTKRLAAYEARKPEKAVEDAADFQRMIIEEQQWLASMEAARIIQSARLKLSHPENRL